MEMQAVMIASQLISTTDDFTVKVFIFADHQVDVSTFKNIFFCRQSKTTEFKHSSTEKLPCLLKTQRYPGLPQLLCLLPHQNVVPSGPSATGQSTSSKSTSIPGTSATAKPSVTPAPLVKLKSNRCATSGSSTTSVTLARSAARGPSYTSRIFTNYARPATTESSAKSQPSETLSPPAKPNRSATSEPFVASKRSAYYASSTISTYSKNLGPQRGTSLQNNSAESSVPFR